MCHHDEEEVVARQVRKHLNRLIKQIPHDQLVKFFGAAVALLMAYSDRSGPPMQLAITCLRGDLEEAGQELYVWMKEADEAVHQAGLDYSNRN